MKTNSDPVGSTADVHDPTQTLEFLVIEDSTSLADLPEEHSGAVHQKSKKKQRERERMLLVSDPLYKELYAFQHNVAPWERKNLLALTYEGAVTYRDQLKSDQEKVQRDRKAEFDAQVNAAVASALDARTAVAEKVPQNPPAAEYVAGMDRLDSTLCSEREKELETAYATSLATAQGGLEAEKQTNQSLRERLAAEELERAALQARIATQESQAVVDERPVVAVAPEVQPIIDSTRATGWQTAQRWLFAVGAVIATLGVLAVLFLFMLKIWNAVPEKAEVAAESEKSQQSQSAQLTSQQRSTPTTEEIDNDWEVVRIRKLIDRNRALSQKGK